MMNKFAAIGLGAIIALAPLAALAQTTAPATTGAKPMATATGTHRSHLRRHGNAAGERARASAHHMHHMRNTPAAKTTP